ncbi:MAG: hypothetical protein AB8D52_08760 [Gammaproteobacteria bacterium]
MNYDELKKQTVAYMAICYPSMENLSPLVDECFDSALESFSREFICRFRPEAWAKATIVYHMHFLDTGIDISIGEIFSVVIRDSIQNNRMDFLTQNLAQQKAFDQKYTSEPSNSKTPSLSVVKSTKDQK